MRQRKELHLEIVDPRAKKRLNIYLPASLLNEIGQFARKLSDQFERRVGAPEAIRLLCTAALSAEKSSEKAPKARGSKS